MTRLVPVLLLYLSSIQPIDHYSIARCLLLVRVLHILITKPPTRLTCATIGHWVSTSIPREPLTPYADQESWKGVLGKTHTRLKGRGRRTAHSPAHPLGIRQTVAPIALWHGVQHCTVLCVEWPFNRRQRAVL
jgi:hypothetical protein